MTEQKNPQPVLPFSPQQSGERTRLYGLDWLRVWATLAVVLLHAGIPYMTNTLPELVWASYSPIRSDAVNLICWAINGCIMPIFFIMSGYFAAQLFKTKGANGFAVHRLKRIGGPLLFGFVFVLPLSLYAWLTGWIIDGIVPLKVYRTLSVPDALEQSILGPAHLWYLEALLVFCLCMWWLSKYSSRLNQKPSRITLGLGVLIGLGTMCLCLTYSPTIVIGFRNSLFPLPSTLLYYSVPFLLGWVWFSHPLKQQKTPSYQWTGIIGLACAVFVVMWPGLKTHLEGDASSVQNVMVPIMFVAYGMLMSCGWFGLALNWNVSKPPAAIRYAAKASLWVYLFHHPLVAITQVVLEPLEVSVAMKFALVTVISVMICLLSYEVLGRRTWAAVVLNGRRDLLQTEDRNPSIEHEKQRAA